MTIALGLLAAVLWGMADFLIRLSGRTLGVHRSMLYTQGFGAVSVGAWLVLTPGVLGLGAQAPAGAWAAALTAAPIGFAGTLALYRGLEIGKMGLVSPVAGAYGAVAALLSILGGEPVGALKIAGLASSALGTALVAARSDPAETEGGSAGGRRSGLVWAAIACLCFGVQFWMQGRFAAPTLGAIIPVWLYYAFATVALGVAALVRRPCLALSRPEARMVFGTGAVGVGGFLALSAGLATGHAAVVSVLTSLQSTVAVALAFWLLKERLAPHRWLGMLLVAFGLGMIRAG